jgi:2-succinyl-6-hydroxy-2,4-cyclohexadiene-1-carboxylate synthase
MIEVMAAPALVFLHGFTHTGASWDSVRKELGERYRAWAPDIRGHGVASETTPVDLAHVIEDVAALVSGPFTLVGYSMGGRIALHVALALGHRVNRLVLIGASPGIEDPVERAARQGADEALADRIEGMAIEDFAEEWARTPVLSGLPPRAAQAVHADRLRNGPSGLARALRGLGTGALPSLWSRLSELSVPVSLIAGERDKRFSALASAMAEGIEQAEVVIVAGAGHAVHLEAPDRVAVIVTAATNCNPDNEI